MGAFEGFAARVVAGAIRAMLRGWPRVWLEGRIAPWRQSTLARAIDSTSGVTLGVQEDDSTTKRRVALALGAGGVLAHGFARRRFGSGGRGRTTSVFPRPTRPSRWPPWDEALLDAIRRDLPAPTVHARNLFHVSVAMWDAWAAYDPDAAGVFVDEKAGSDDPIAAREQAISYAAYRVLQPSL